MRRSGGTHSLTHTGRRTLAAAGDWFTRHPIILPVAILIAGAAFRVYNLNWDNGHLLHPDEREIYLVLSGNNQNPAIGWPSSLSQFLSVRSPLNPHFFAYGSLPFYLLAFLAGVISFLGQHVPFLSQWSQLDTYGGLPLLGRGLSATLDLFSVGLVFVLARRMYGYWTALLAMALGAFTVLDIQLSHFYAVDTVLLPLVLLTLLAAVTIAQSNARSAYIWGGAACGAALATKTTALLLVIPLAAAAVLAAWSGQEWPSTGGLAERLRRHYQATGRALNINLQWLLATYVVAAVVFAICEPYAILDRQQLVQDISTQSNILVTNNPPFYVPFTDQYAGTVPYLYQLKNLLFWSMGIPLALAAFAGVLAAVARSVGRRVRADEAVLLLWIVPYFLFVGRFFAKFNRYMLPITPLMTILGAALLVWLVRRARGHWRTLAWIALAGVTALSFLYSLAYMNIYEHPNTRVAASRWMFSHIPKGSTLALESSWDDGLPLDEQGHTGSEFNSINLQLYDNDDRTKVDRLSHQLLQADYIVMTSERLIGSIPRRPGAYPITIRYYDLLTRGKLGYRLVAVFQQHPQLGPFVVHDYPADESFHVYDHPIVRVFKRVSSIPQTRLASLLTAGTTLPGPVPAAQPASAALRPDSRLMLNRAQWQADQQGPTLDQMFPPAGFAMQHPILVWLLVLELLGLIAFPFTFLLFANLLDRGFVIAKTVGLLLTGYVVWIAVTLGIGTFDRGFVVLVILLVAAISGLLAYFIRADLAAFFRLGWRSVLVGELVFLTGFVLFILLRMWYPDLGHQFSPVSPANLGDGRMGEKQMELAFLNAIVRSRTFPPYDPFFAHGYINYYYYGFYLVGLLCKVTQIMPASGLNLAIATLFALLVASIFSVGLSLTRRIAPGLLAAVFVGALGNLNGAWQLIRGLMSVATVHSAVPLWGGAVDVLSGLQQVLLNHQTLPPFDFWESTRIVPPAGGPITEFPYFTYLFADLHPHLIAYPMTAAALALAVSLALGPYPRRRQALFSLVLGALLVGAIAVTNPWDYPTYLAVLGMGFLVGVYALRRRLGFGELARAGLWLAGVAALSLLLYLPFERDYQTVFATGIGLVRDITPGILQGNNIPPDQVRDAVITPLRIYLEHFGLFVFAIASYLTLLLWADAGGAAWARRAHVALRFAAYYRDHPGRLWRAMKSTRRMIAPREPVVDSSLLTGFVILAGGLALLHYFLLTFLIAALGLAVLLTLRLGSRLPAAQLFLLVLIVLPVALSLGTQVFFIKDWLAGGADFRMNTIFKFYNQAWVLYSVAAAISLYYFVARQPSVPPTGSDRPESAPRVWGSRISRWRAPGSRAFSRLWTTKRPPPNAEEGSRQDLPLRGVAPGRRVSHTPSRGGPPHAGPVFAFASAGGRPLESVAPHDEPAEDRPSDAAETSMDVPHVGRPPGGWIKNRLTPRLSGLDRPVAFIQRRPLWSLCLGLLLAASCVYTYAGTVSRETYRTAWLPENSVPFTLDGMAFMKVAYPADYAGISWLNAHVHGAQVIAEADSAYYNWRSRVSMFTGLPDILNGIHEPEQRYADELDARNGAVDTLYSTTNIGTAWRILRTYDVRYVYVGFSELQCVRPQCYPRAGLAKFDRMVGHGLAIAFHQPGVTVYAVTRR